jgi:hypothetical protein
MESWNLDAARAHARSEQEGEAWASTLSHLQVEWNRACKALPRFQPVATPFDPQVWPGPTEEKR